MNALSLFSGIGGIDLACEWAGIKTVAMCEREPFCQKVLHKHWPDVPIYDDVCTLTKERLEADGIETIELIHGGYPCQPFSNAGNRQGAEDDRHLWPEVCRLIKTIKPRWFVGENVAGHVTLGLDIVLADLESIGYAWETFVIPASAVDARHRRDRIFIVAYPKSFDQRGLSIREKTKHARLTLGGENVPDSTSPGLPIGRRPEWTEGNKKTGTGMEPESKRRSPDVANANCITGLETSPKISPIRGKRKSWDHASWSGGEYIPGTDWWAAEPSVGRVANGIPNRVDRLKALGNAVVPQQIYPILAAIKQIDDMMEESA